MVPRGDESKENLDKNVFFYTCRESGPTCRPNGANEVYSGDNGGDNTISCGDTITLPDWLPAGDYVLQWTWMSVGSSYGHRAWANPQYRSCADIHLSTEGTRTQPKCPTFVGSDRVGELKEEGDDVCFYFNSNDIVNDVFKGDDNNADQYYKFGVPKQIETCGGASTSTTGKANDTKKPLLRTEKPSVSKDDSEDEPPGVVRPAGAKREWEFCSENSECANQCCSNKYSDDGKLKCTPNDC